MSAMAAQDSPRRSRTPKKRSWYALVPEHVELSPSRSCSPSSRRSSESSRSESPAPSKPEGLLEYSSASQISTLEEGPLDQTKEDGKETSMILESKSEEIRVSASLMSEYFDAKQSQSAIDVTGGITRESFPLVEGEITQESSVSLEMSPEQSGSEASRVEVVHEVSRDHLQEEGEMGKDKVTEGDSPPIVVSESGSAPIVDSHGQGGEIGESIPGAVTERTDLGSEDNSVTQSGHSSSVSAAVDSTVLDEVLEHSLKDEVELQKQEQVMEEVVPPAEPAGVISDGEIEAQETLDEKYLRVSDQMDPQLSENSRDRPDGEFQAEAEIKQPVSLDTLASKEGNISDGPEVSGEDSHTDQDRSSSSQDSQSISKSGSFSGDSMSDEQRMRGSQVQLPLDLNSLQPLTQSPPAASRSGVVLSQSVEGARQMNQYSEADVSSEEVKVSKPLSVPLKSTSSYIKYPPELQSRPASHDSGLKQADSGRQSGSDSRLIRPSDLYGSPRGQDLEDSLARKVAQLLIESGQITFQPKEKQQNASKVSTRSSSCSGTPDSIEGSITPSSQKDFPDGRDIFPRRDSLNNKEKSGRASPASSVSSCTDSLALHVQQLLKESEHLRAKMPGQEVRHGVSSGIRDSANTSDMSTSSSVKRIIKKVNANLPGSDSDYDVDPVQRTDGQRTGIQTTKEFGRESPRIVNAPGAEYRGSPQSSPRSYGSHGRNSPYLSDSGRESPRYQGEVTRGSPSHVRSMKMSRPLSQISQERGQLSEGSFASSHTRDSLSQRVQNILASTEYVEGVTPRYQSQQDETFYPVESAAVGRPQHYSPSRSLSHGSVNGHQDIAPPRSQVEGAGSYQHRLRGPEDAESVARRIQAILMEEAPKENVDRILREAGIPHLEDSPYTSPPEFEQESRSTSYHTAQGGSHADGIDNFQALERARAVLENQLQRVTERTFDHSIVWETPGKHRRVTEDVHEKGPPVRPVEAWADSRVPGRSDQHYSLVPGESSQQTLADPQLEGYPRSETIPRADEEYYSLPTSTTVIRRDQRASYDPQEVTGARPRSYPQVDASRIPSYHRSLSTPDGQSGIPRRTTPTPSAIPRASHSRSSSLGKANDFDSHRRYSQEYTSEQEVYSLPPQRPLSATLPRSRDRSRRTTFGSSVHSVSGSSPPSASRVSRGTSPDRNILHPYRPPGSAETLYTYQVDQGGKDVYSSTINSSTTMESTHTGSDDAQPPAFPAHVLGSRKDPPKRDGSFIPRTSPRDYSSVPGEVRSHITKGSKLPTLRRESSPDPSAAIGRDISGTKPMDIPLDLSRPRRERLEDPRLSSSAPGRASPSAQKDYPPGQDYAFPDKAIGAERDVHYGRLPSQDSRFERTPAFTYSGSRGQEMGGRGQRSEVPGSYSRKVLTDVLQNEDDKLAQADDMWRQYQQLKEHQQDEKEAEGISGASSIDESRIQRLASLVKDPVGHTARKIAREVGHEEDREENRRRKEDPKEEQVTDLSKSDQDTREEADLGIQLDDGLDSVQDQMTKKTQTSFVIGFEAENGGRGKEVQSAKRQKTSKMIPPTGIPQRDMRPKKKIIPKPVTPTKRKAVTLEVDEPSTDITETTPETVLSDLSLDSEQLLLLLGSHGIKKLSSKLLHLQQRIEKQKEHHRKQSAGQKPRKPKHTVGKKKTIPRPAHASTPAEEPDAELAKEVAEIVRGKVEEGDDRTPSTVSSLTLASRQTSEPDSVPESSSEGTLVDARQISIPERKLPTRRQLPKDDSEVEYRTSEAESDISILCSCRPVLRRPRSAQETRRKEPQLVVPQEINLGGVFKRPIGVAPRSSSRIPVKNGGAGLPDGDNRNHVSPTPAKKIPRGTAFTIDLSQQDHTSQRRRGDKDAPEEKGVLTDLPEKSRDERRALVQKRDALKMVNKENVTPKPSKLTPPGIAWFQPLSKKMPWQEERPRPKPMIIAALQADPKTGKLSLQDAFLRHRPDFISQCRERQRKMKLAAEERHLQASLELERVRLFEEQKAKKANPLAHPYSDQLHKPAKRNLSRKEMKQQTQKIYSRLPEVVRKKEENKKEIINQTNRLRAQIYRKKLSDRLKAGWPNR